MESYVVLLFLFFVFLQIGVDVKFVSPHSSVILLIFERVSLCGPGWPGTLDVN